MGQCCPPRDAQPTHLNALIAVDSVVINSTDAPRGSPAPRSPSRKPGKGRRRNRNETKLLLLGTGNSGKSTVFKQFQLVHRGGFKEEERLTYATLIVESTLSTIQKMLQHAKDLLFEGDLPEEDFDRELTERLQREADEEMRRAEAEGGGGGGALFLQGFLKHTAEMSRSFGTASSRGTNASSSRGTNASSAGPSPGVSLRDVLPSTKATAAAAAAAAAGQPQQDARMRRNSSDSSRHGAVGGGSVVSDEVAHLADMVMQMREGTMLYERFTVPRTVQRRDGADVEECETLTLAQMLRLLWQEPVMQRVYAMDGKIPTLEAPIGYYMANLDRIAREDFRPSDDDMLFARKQTRRVQQLQFKVENRNFLLVDPGGQRIERPNWINYCEDVDALLYVVGLDGFAQLCIEDGRTNRMRESLEVFKELCEAPFFLDTNVILFLNKRDVFEEKIKRVPLNVCFNSYEGRPHDFDEAVAYISRRFSEAHLRAMDRAAQHGAPRFGNAPKPKVYPYVTEATAKANMRFVIDACKAVFLRKIMAQTGIASF